MMSHYIFVRRDLPLGNLAAHITHASGESAVWNRELIHGSARAVVLEAKDQSHLAEIRFDLVTKGIPFVNIIESSGEFAGQLMAIGVVPIEQDLIQHKLEDYQTLKTCRGA